MTVKDMRELLAGLPDDMPVLVCDFDLRDADAKVTKAVRCAIHGLVYWLRPATGAEDADAVDALEVY